MTSDYFVQDICWLLWNSAVGDKTHFHFFSSLSILFTSLHINGLVSGKFLLESELCWHQKYLQLFLDMSSSVLSICTFQIYTYIDIPNAVLSSSKIQKLLYEKGFVNKISSEGLKLFKISKQTTNKQKTCKLFSV